MPRIQPVERSEVSPEAGTIWDEQLQVHGRMTNMKRTLARSSLSLRVLMEWYPLRDKVAAAIGSRATTLFAHAVSVQSSCLVCSTFFRRILIDNGENPDNLLLNPKEQLLVAFGRGLVTDANNIPDSLYRQLRGIWSEEEIIDLTVFAGMMVATNMFNNAMRVDLDDYLEPYRGMLSEAQVEQGE